MKTIPKGIYRGAKTLSLMPTFTCPAACENCGTLSTPEDKTNLSLEKVISSINQAKALNFDVVVFTGGEATLRWKDLIVAIKHAKSLQLPTRLVTNAHWATDIERAKNKLTQLISAGLDEINYSTGDEHIKFIPIEKVINATIAAYELNFSLYIMVECTKVRKITKQKFVESPEFIKFGKDIWELVTVGESPWMPLSPVLIEEYPEGMTINKSNLANCKGCESILSTYTVQADGRVASCCGLGMRLIPELNVVRTDDDNFLAKAIEESESDLLKLWIKYKGTSKILAWAAEKDESIVWEDFYSHNCQACQRIYRDKSVIKVIKENYQEVVADVIQHAWLEEEYIPQVLKEYQLEE